MLAFWKIWRNVIRVPKNRQVGNADDSAIVCCYNYAPKWEPVALAPDDADAECKAAGGTSQSTSEQRAAESDEKDKEKERKTPIKMLKIALPHFLLITLLLSYLAVGATILQRLENGTEITRRHGKLTELDRLFRWVINETWKLRDDKIDYYEWHDTVYNKMQNISIFYFKRPVGREQPPLETKWTFHTAVLYTLTVLTACGYSTIDPVTNEGMIFAVVFALLGIPLMFITAADIGKFLSETFVSLAQFCSSTYSSFMWKFCPKKMKAREKATAEAKARAAAAADDLDPERLLSGEDEEGMDNSLWLPIGGYFFSMCLYCSFGAILFRTHETWGFIHAFHFAFNTVVTVGMGDVVVEDAIYLCLIVAYVIIGLAVVTMCIDLASSHLQRYFQKIHYFGRARKRFLGMSEDIREMMSLITAMRKRKAGGKVTWNDLKEYLEYGPDGRRAFVPRNIHLWKFVDDTNSAISTYRRHSTVSVVSGSSDYDRRISGMDSAPASARVIRAPRRRPRAAEV
uniref:Potassium channel domain-containing protein n=1 Tax=Romanomermis culicivorax TaxID=13658 RepID=A0A915JND3_ROMCU